MNNFRTHNAGALRAADRGKTVTLSGWVSRVRDHGGVNFVDLRDRWGVTQVVFRPEGDASLQECSKSLRPEFCIQVKGRVEPRPAGTVNKDLPTGEVEVIAGELVILSRSETPPFEVTSDEKITEELRLKYRYLDLRRPPMQEGLLFRSRLLHEMRCFLQALDFFEVETPVLTKSTPEGARDYLVPSRVNQGQFFALPQSPQLFKQLLMVSGFERYFQIAKCFRDEDLRADRQPEFTQLDVEMSFVEENDIFDLIEKLLAHLFKTVLKKDLQVPFRRMPYSEAVSRYGTDKPDLRFGLPLTDLSELFKNTSLKIFRETLLKGGGVYAIHVHRPETEFSRKEFDDLIETAKRLGLGGLAYLRVSDKGFESPIAKFFSPEETEGLKTSFDEKLETGDVVFFASDQKRKALGALGQIRLILGERLGRIRKDEISFHWVNEFPLFQWNAEDKRWESEHHPFTSPHKDDIPKVGADNGNIRSQSYDLVLNGSEIASGSIRIHEARLQQKIFDTIGIDEEKAKERFGFLLNAFKFGPPPHGGIALGLDRFAAILLGKDSIREIIAFPKNQKAVCPLTDAPGPVDERQLKELGIKVL